jgi:hypothetical protein
MISDYQACSMITTVTLKSIFFFHFLLLFNTKSRRRIFLLFFPSTQKRNEKKSQRDFLIIFVLNFLLVLLTSFFSFSFIFFWQDHRNVFPLFPCQRNAFSTFFVFYIHCFRYSNRLSTYKHAYMRECQKATLHFLYGLFHRLMLCRYRHVD